MSAEIYDAMVAHALRGLPFEACGLFGGPYVEPDQSAVLTDFWPMTNTAASTQLYVLDGAEMIDVERRADAAGTAVLGVMHSHTHTTAYPSPTDVADAARFDPFGTWWFVIVSLKHAEPTVRAYRIDSEAGGAITEGAVRVSNR